MVRCGMHTLVGGTLPHAPPHDSYPRSDTLLAYALHQGGHADCDTQLADDSFAWWLESSRAATQPKTPRLAGCGATSPLFFCLLMGPKTRARQCRALGHFSVSRCTRPTNASKSTGFGTCMSNPAFIAASTSDLDT